MEKEQQVAMTIRLPITLRIDIDKIAKAENRSVNSMITYILKRYCDEHKRKRKGK